ncbi:DUF1501 domain-containing protein [Wenzhouxiangella sp. XN79A]|uniref:DUF1501 domain-containing protein n=1 Tax=Wenzhouxiangella sp. XN79A TaxID=2724193 RepID=UPI00144ACFCA|nr:DUF1501 domain-containing protein [Wenzhouxiangella sp. XN79A]NKI36360.1 DUF1501 domain-containing protein [Wenzhouxiangella sp. XN79A]
MKRRTFLHTAALTGGAALAPRWAWSAAKGATGGDRLIAIYLRGGTDGLTVCPPLGEPAYFDVRPTLAVGEAEALPLDGFFGLHPAAGGLKDLFDAGDLAVIHASGLKTAERSHFEAQATMELGVDAGDLKPADGWIGRYLAELAPSDPLSVVSLDAAVPKSMTGPVDALAIGRIDEFQLALGPLDRSALLAAYAGDPLLMPTATGVFQAADALGPAAALPPGADYPQGQLGAGLADCARLIKAEVGLQVAAIDSGGWDHHDDQAEQIDPLLADLGGALAAFREDIGPAWDTTTVVVMTEFGRRVRENASLGTDHGHGGVMFAAGGNVHGGQVFGDWPGLGPGDLSDGQDLRVTTDYRQVLAELLVDRLGVIDPTAILGGWTPGPGLGLFRPAAGAAKRRSGAGRSVS